MSSSDADPNIRPANTSTQDTDPPQLLPRLDGLNADLTNRITSYFLGRREISTILEVSPSVRDAFNHTVTHITLSSLGPRSYGATPTMMSLGNLLRRYHHPSSLRIREDLQDTELLHAMAALVNASTVAPNGSFLNTLEILDISDGRNLPVAGMKVLETAVANAMSHGKLSRLQKLLIQSKAYGSEESESPIMRALTEGACPRVRMIDIDLPYRRDLVTSVVRMCEVRAGRGEVLLDPSPFLNKRFGLYDDDVDLMTRFLRLYLHHWRVGILPQR